MLLRVCGSKVEKDSTKADIPCADNTKLMSKTAKFLDYILNSKSKSTYKQYKMSINLFTTYFNETHNTNVTSDDLIEMRKQDFLTEDMERQKRFHREIEKFHKWMIDGKKDKDGKWIREPYEINSARNLTLGIIQLFKYYGYLTNVSFETVVTTKDFVPTIQQYRDRSIEVFDSQAQELIQRHGIEVFETEKLIGSKVFKFKENRDFYIFKSRLEHFFEDLETEHEEKQQRDQTLISQYIETQRQSRADFCLTNTDCNTSMSTTVNKQHDTPLETLSKETIETIENSEIPVEEIENLAEKVNINFD